MKAFTAILVFLVSATAAMGQTAPGLRVVSYKWRSEIRNPLIDFDQSKEAKEDLEKERQRRAQEARNDKLRELDMPPRHVPPPKLSNEKRPSPSIFYKYEVKFANSSKLKVTRVLWEYVFIDPASGQELGRRRFESVLGIGPGKSKTVVERSASPPTGSLGVREAGMKEKDMFLGQILIKAVRYANGTEWESPGLSPTPQMQIPQASRQISPSANTGSR